MSYKREPWEEWHKKNGVSVVIRECEKRVPGKWGDTVTYRYRVATHTGEWHVPTLEDARAIAKHVCSCAHKGVAYYDRQRMRKKLPATCGGPLKGPPEFIGNWRGHRWCAETGDYVREYATIDEAAKAAEETSGRVALAADPTFPEDGFWLADILRYECEPNGWPFQVSPVQLYVFSNEAGEWFCRYERSPRVAKLESGEWVGGSGSYSMHFGGDLCACVTKRGSKWKAEILGAEQPWRDGYRRRFEAREDSMRMAKYRAEQLYTEYQAERMTYELQDRADAA